MSNIFLILFLVSVLGLIIGLVRPSILKFKSRKSAGFAMGVAILGSFVLFGITTPTPPKETKPLVDTTTQEVVQVTKSEPKKEVVAEKTVSPTPVKTEPQKPTVPAEYKSALNTAGSYANKMHMSKRKLYDQLVSEYGEKFTAAAAQYAIDNVKADWNANALATAKNYQNTMNMSPAKIHEQLTSEYGEKFTQAEADYAIQHLND